MDCQRLKLKNLHISGVDFTTQRLGHLTRRNKARLCLLIVGTLPQVNAQLGILGINVMVWSGVKDAKVKHIASVAAQLRGALCAESCFRIIDVGNQVRVLVAELE